MKKIITDRKLRRKIRVSSNIHGTAERPRISVYRSSKQLFVQAIDDVAQKTLISVSTRVHTSGTKSDRSFEAGKQLAQKLSELKVTAAVFDRGPYTYLGRVKRFAEGLREGGLQI